MRGSCGRLCSFTSDHVAQSAKVFLCFLLFFAQSAKVPSTVREASRSCGWQVWCGVGERGCAELGRREAQPTEHLLTTANTNTLSSKASANPQA